MDKANTTGTGGDAAIVEALRQALDSGDLVLFVGGGVSAAAGLPTWQQLVHQLVEEARERSIDELVVDEVAELARAQRYTEALAAAEHALGADDFGDLVQGALDDAGYEPPPIACALAALRDKLRAVLTTNINHLLERAFGWEALARVTGDVASRRRFILKLHGTLMERDTWVFTRESFHATLAPLEVRTALSALLTACPVLFVGFGRADGNFDSMLQDIRALSGDAPPPRFALVPSASLMPYRRKSLHEMGFQLLSYDNPDGRHAQALALLDIVGGGAWSRRRVTTRSILPPPPTIPAPPAPAIPDLELPPSSSSFFEAPPDSSAYDAPASVQADSPRRGRVSEPPASPIEIFFSYSDHNRELRDKLEMHLAILKRKGVIRGWHDGEVGAGEERDKALLEHLESAKIILLLISADFLASDFCYDVEMQKAIARHKRGEARVIPVILDACDWEEAPFGELESLPRPQGNQRRQSLPVTSWANQSEAFTDIARGIRKQVELITQNPSSAHRAPAPSR